MIEHGDKEIVFISDGAHIPLLICKHALVTTLLFWFLNEYLHVKAKG